LRNYYGALESFAEPQALIVKLKKRKAAPNSPADFPQALSKLFIPSRLAGREWNVSAEDVAHVESGSDAVHSIARLSL